MASVLNHIKVGYRSVTSGQSILDRLKFNKTVYVYKLLDSTTLLPLSGISVDIQGAVSESLVSDSEGIIKSNIFNPNILSTSESNLYEAVSITDIDYYSEILIDAFPILIPPRSGFNELTDNRYNFFHFHRIVGLTLSQISELSQIRSEYPEFFPNFFNEQHNQVYSPMLLEGELYSNQINFIDKISSDTSNWQIDIISGDQVILSDIAPLSVYGSVDKIVYFEFTPSGISGEDFQFLIHDNNTGFMVMMSNCFEIKSEDSDYRDESVHVKFRNSTNLDNFEYDNLPDFYNQFRITLNSINYDYEYELTTYREQSTGRRRRQKSQKSKFVELEAYLFDQYALDAAASLCDHDEIYINGDKVNLKKGFSTSIQSDMKTHKASAEFYIEKYSTVNLKG